MPEHVYRKVYTLFWRDADVRALTAAEKLVAVYVLTSPQSNGCGIFAFSPGMASEDTRLPGTLGGTLQGTLPETLQQGFDDAFKVVVDKLGWKWDSEARVVYIPRWWKWNKPDNPNTLKGAMGRLDEVPETPLLQEFALNLEHLKPALHETFQERYAERYAERYPKGYPKPSRTQRTRNKEQGTVDLKDICFEETDPESPVAQYWEGAADWASLTFWGEPSTICHHGGKGPPPRERVFLLRLARLVDAGHIPGQDVADAVHGCKETEPRNVGAVLRTILRDNVDNFEAMLAKVPTPPDNLKGESCG